MRRIGDRNPPSSAQASENERQAERERLDQEVKTAEGRKADSAREKAAIMAFISGLSEGERDALEQGFREHLVATVPAIVAKRFKSGETWVTDPIIRAEAIAYFSKNLKIRPSGI